MVIVVVRPVMRAVRSASRIGGRPSTGRIVTLVTAMSIDRPSSGTGGPLGRNGGERHVGRDLDPLDGAADDVLHHPVAHLGSDEDRPQPLERGDRHLVAGDADRQPRLAAEIDIARQRDADVLGVPAELLGAEIALIDREALPHGIERAAHQDAPEHQPVVLLRKGIEHDQAAADRERPAAAGLCRARQIRRAA